MGFIREPEGVDFTVVNKPLTTKERKMISDYIKMAKDKELKSQTKNKRR
jgi:hypothetical protein